MYCSQGNKCKEHTKLKGFTLIELIVVMAIIAVLVLLAAPRFLGYTKDADIVAMQQDVKVLSDTVEIYQVNEDAWPVIEGADSTYIGYGGLGNIYPLDESKLEGSIKNMKGDFNDYGVATDGKYRGQVFHLKGVEGKGDELVFGGNVKITDYSARPKPQTELGLNLVKNGDGSYGDNTNFKQFKYSSNLDDNGPALYIDKDVGTIIVGQDEFIPVEPELTYNFKYHIKSNIPSGNSAYGMVRAYDIDKLEIRDYHHIYKEGTTTTLAKPLKRGDRKIYLTDTTNWLNETSTVNNHQKAIIFWNYTDKTGYTYPIHTYSRNYSPRNLWDNGGIDYEENTITLRNEWPSNAKEYPAGTKLSNSSDGNNFKYVTGGIHEVPNTWLKKQGFITGIDYSGNNNLNSFPPGTKYMKAGWILNYNRDNPASVHLSDISITIEQSAK